MAWIEGHKSKSGDTTYFVRASLGGRQISIMLSPGTTQADAERMKERYEILHPLKKEDPNHGVA